MRAWRPRRLGVGSVPPLLSTNPSADGYFNYQYEKPGDLLIEGSMEWRQKLVGPINYALFIDAGNVWADSFGFKLGELRYAIGPGLRYQTPVGPIRVDFGYQLNPTPDLLVNGRTQTRRFRLHFSIGQAF